MKRTLLSTARLLPGLTSAYRHAVLCAAAVCIFAAAQADARENAPAKANTTALVLATFGSTVEQKDDTLALVKAALQKRCPDVPQFTAYTSTHVARVLKKRGQEAKGLNQTLADLAADGYTKVIVQSLHVTPGKEFDAISAIAAVYPALPKGSLRVAIGLPLLASHDDCEMTARILAASLPQERSPEDAVIFIGHGAENRSGSLSYPALQAFLQQIDPKLFVGTIEGPYNPEKLLASLSDTKTVWLVPLLTIVGEHARNDIFGDEDSSWKQRFSKAGFSVRLVNRGLFALPGIADMYAAHAGAAFEALENVEKNTASAAPGVRKAPKTLATIQTEKTAVAQP